MKQFIQIADRNDKRWIRADDIVMAEIDADSATLTLTYKIHLKTYDALASARLHGDLMQAAIEGLEL